MGARRSPLSVSSARGRAAAGRGGRAVSRSASPTRALVARGQQEAGGAAAQGGLQGVERGLRGQRFHAELAAHALACVGVEGHAAVAPQRPVDGEAAAGAPLQVVVEEAVGVRVVALARVAEDRGRRAERHEVVGGVRAGRLVEVDQAAHLGCEHRVGVRAALVEDEPVTERTGRVHHAGDPAEPAPGLGHRPLDVRAHTYVGPDVQPALGQRLGRVGPADEDDSGARVAGDPLRRPARRACPCRP